MTTHQDLMRCESDDAIDRIDADVRLEIRGCSRKLVAPPRSEFHKP